ncbi:hypothetical protein QBC47DRAFT_209282 [Echria macrotheca]|uniref:Uncharacterized protein n=1 Tax=Echria macrotheca TaxID=438768 RepID=A0AAJ0FBF1_9PEZI|nr:hypothetical protein QBC47DRAFT_209282 [Echria macrotheca]
MAILWWVVSKRQAAPVASLWHRGWKQTNHGEWGWRKGAGTPRIQRRKKLTHQRRDGSWLYQPFETDGRRLSILHHPFLFAGCLSSVKRAEVCVRRGDKTLPDPQDRCDAVKIRPPQPFCRSQRRASGPMPRFRCRKGIKSSIDTSNTPRNNCLLFWRHHRIMSSPSWNLFGGLLPRGSGGYQAFTLEGAKAGSLAAAAPLLLGELHAKSNHGTQPTAPASGHHSTNTAIDQSFPPRQPAIRFR